MSVWPELYELGSEIDFSETSNSSQYALTGWGHPEPWGRWTVGALAELCLPLDRPLGPRAKFEAVVVPYVRGRHRPLNVEIYFGQHLVRKLAFSVSGRRKVRVAIPATLCEKETQVRIGIRILNPQSPLSLGRSNDARPLGLGFMWAWLK
ncbi:MAG TPA: hypothetical protein VHZ07_27350 [Bryobacteraceae bacterium]|jgi:hypothetical protein|nr:hypothetical protein [Bryobacteraceae bacterium]